MKNSNILYGKPGCVQCTATERYLDKHEIPYTKIDVSQDEVAYEYVTQTLGYTQVPVMETTDTHWYGFIPDRLATLV